MWRTLYLIGTEENTLANNHYHFMPLTNTISEHHVPGTILTSRDKAVKTLGNILALLMFKFCWAERNDDEIDED